MKKEVVENKTAKNEAIKVTELKASMLDELIKTYLDVDDTDARIDMLLNQISVYVDLLIANGSLERWD